MRKIFWYMILLSVILIITVCFATFAHANTNYIDFGFGQRIIGTAQIGDMFASNIPYGTLPTYNKTITFASVDMPTVVDLDRDGFNEIYLYSTNGVSMYNNFASLTSSYPATISKRGAVASDGTQSDYSLYLLNNQSGNYSVIQLKKNGFSLSAANIYDIPDRSYAGYIYGGQSLYIPDINGNLTIMNTTDGSTKFVGIFGNDLNNTALVPSTSFFYFSNPIVTGDLNRDGCDEIYIAYNDLDSGTKVRIALYSYSPTNNCLGWITRLNNPCSDATDCQSDTRALSLGSGVVGTSGSAPYIFMMADDSTNQDIRVMDLTLNRVFSKQINVAGDTFAFPFVGEINKDGNNEFCLYNRLAGLECYDSTFTLLSTSILPACTVKGTILSAGWYAKPLIGNAGGENITIMCPSNIAAGYMYQPNGTNFINQTRVYGLNSGRDAVLPVTVYQQNAFVKDFVVVGRTAVDVMFSDFITATCGNGICEGGETSLNCFQDCGISSPTQAVITESSINPCNTQVWLINTTVLVTMKVESSDNSNVAARVVFDQNQDTGWTNFSHVGSVFSFFFKANQSIVNNQIFLYAKTQNNPTVSSVSYSYSVSPTFGISYGQSSCGIKQPLNATLALLPTNTTTNINSNFLVRALQPWNILGLGVDILWMIVMLLFAVAMYVYAGIKNFEKTITFGTIVIVELFLFIIGTKVGFLSSGIIITIVVVGIILIGIWLRNKFTNPQQ